ncbi:wax ester/triacylglycerol synthase family O-acyltransferase [Geodermatophilus aquaeductus]|uniref:Diacylglycerol O-acyltransferase n=1 Tax=Geodermatophilus aquaeductus TaxID=1564161 RepID=A0A521FV70_9ACTN|nr:wax ester/triacylglycerol synthase family O-acyltransferase [Geodermatophilus aquaeductus]SMP00036.1 Diacylglycerol O-acyltransferase [Geodermatophilus aquaeductus]
MDRMGPLDAAFLQIEDEQPGTSLAISSIAVFEGPVPSAGEFETALAGRLALIPRYRQEVRQVPFDLGPPVWVDAPDFDLAYHLRRTALPAPGGDRELAALMGRVMSQRLDRNRPLWEYWLVEGLAEDRWALISKVHHCMADGVSGTDLYRVVLDPGPEPGPAVPDDWHPRPEPSTAELTALAARDLATLPWRTTRALAGTARSPRALGRLLLTTARGTAALATALLPTRASSLTGPLSAQRRYAFARGRVEDVSAIRDTFGGTFNDVVMTAVTAGFRQLLISRGERPAPHVIRSLVPVSVRAPGEESIRDNRVSSMLADLPVDVADPLERLAAVRELFGRLKAEHEAEAGAVLVRLAGAEPFAPVASGMRLTWRLPQRSITTVTTNVPGPRAPLYALGRRCVEIVPYVPIASRLRVGVSMFTYAGRLTFGITGDYDTAADVWTLARGIEDSLDELAAAADLAADAAPEPGTAARLAPGADRRSSDASPAAQGASPPVSAQTRPSSPTRARS